MKNYILCTIFFIFLWSTGLVVGNIVIPFSLFLTYFLIFIFSFFKKKYFLRKLFIIIKLTSVKYLFLFILYAIISTIFLHTKHNTLIISFRVIRDYLLFVFPYVFLPCLLIPKFLSLKKCTNIIILIYCIILMYALFDYLIQTFVPSLHLLLYSFVCNVPKENYTVLQRANGTFLEPTFLATFIFVFLPLIYTLCEHKYKFTLNKFKNRYFFIIIILLSWIVLLLTKSPLYISATIILTIFYIRKNKKIIIISLLCIASMTPIFFIQENNILYNNKVLTRIVNVLTSLNDMEKLVLREGSLATRIGLVNVAVSVAQKHPIIGTGYANDKTLMYQQILYSKFPLTDEIKQQNYKNNGLTISSIFFQTLCWTGFLGAFLLYSFILKPILWINKFKKNIRNKEEYAIITSFNLVAINYVICSVYWSLIADTIMWFIIGIHCSYIMIVKNKIYQIKIRNNI